MKKLFVLLVVCSVGVLSTNDVFAKRERAKPKKARSAIITCDCLVSDKYVGSGASFETTSGSHSYWQSQGTKKCITKFGAKARAGSCDSN